MNILRRNIENKAHCEALVGMKLDDMGIGEPGMEHVDIIRTAAMAYYVQLLQEHLEYSADMHFDEYFDDSEGLVWGFIAGYRTCLDGKHG